MYIFILIFRRFRGHVQMSHFPQLWNHKLAVHVIHLLLQIMNLHFVFLQEISILNHDISRINSTLTTCITSNVSPNTLQDLSYNSSSNISRAFLSIAARSGRGSILCINIDDCCFLKGQMFFEGMRSHCCSFYSFIQTAAYNEHGKVLKYLESCHSRHCPLFSRVKIKTDCVLTRL